MTCSLQLSLIVLFMFRLRHLPFFIKFRALFKELFIYHIGSNEKIQSLDGIHDLSRVATEPSHAAGFYLVMDVVFVLECLPESLEGVELVEAH